MNYIFLPTYSVHLSSNSNIFPLVLIIEEVSIDSIKMFPFTPLIKISLKFHPFDLIEHPMFFYFIMWSFIKSFVRVNSLLRLITITTTKNQINGAWFRGAFKICHCLSIKEVNIGTWGRRHVLGVLWREIMAFLNKMAHFEASLNQVW